MKCRFFDVKCRVVTVCWKISGRRRADTEVHPYTSTIRPPCQRGLASPQAMTGGFSLAKFYILCYNDPGAWICAGAASIR